MKKILENVYSLSRVTLVFSGQQHWMSKSGTLVKHTRTFRRPEFLSYDSYVRIMQLVGGLNSLSFVATLSVCNVPKMSFFI